MRARCIALLLAFASAMPQAAWAKHHHPAAPEPPVDYGIGLLCPTSAGEQLNVYGSYGANQISSDTIVFTPGTGYTIKSDRFETLEAAGVHVFEGYCDHHWPGLRIDDRTDRWVQLGNLWAASGQDWDSLQWQDILQKAPVLHAINETVIYDGGEDDALPGSFGDDTPHGTLGKKSDLRPIRFQDNYVMVEVGKPGAFGDGCTAIPPAANVTAAITGWVRYIDDDGKPLLVPRKPKGC